jgi:hypothetical protein
MDGPGAVSRRGQREIEPLRIEARLERLPFERGFALLESGFQVRFGGVQQFAEAGALFRRDLAHAFADFSEGAFPSEHLDAHRF